MSPNELVLYLESNGYKNVHTPYKLLNRSNTNLTYCHTDNIVKSHPCKGALVFTFARKRAKKVKVKLVREIDVEKKIYTLREIKSVKIKDIKLNNSGKLEGI